MLKNVIRSFTLALASAKHLMKPVFRAPQVRQTSMRKTPALKATQVLRSINTLRLRPIMLTLEKVAFPETTGIRLFSMAPPSTQQLALHCCGGSVYGLAAVFFIPVTDKFSPFVKAGFQVWDLEADVTSSAGNATLSDDGTDPFFGVGFEATVAEGFKLRAEYELYDFDGDDVEFLSAGLTIAYFADNKPKISAFGAFWMKS